MPTNSAGAEFSPVLPIAEWTSRFNRAFPHWSGKPIRVADHYARLVTDRWVYVIAETQDWENEWEVIHELYVDREAKTWITTRATPYGPIPERGHPVAASRAAAQGFIFRRVDPKGHALWVRLLLSPFQLPSAAIVQLSDKRFRQLLHAHVPPLWEWDRGENDTSPLVSRDGWSLRETPLWLTPPEGGPVEPHGVLRQVAVGFDPFTVATTRSTEFINQWIAYQRVYEPDEPAKDSEFQRLMLGKMIDESILRHPAAHEKYGSSVDIAKLNRALEDDEQRRRDLVGAYERAGAALCKVLDSPFFWLYQQASLSEEGIDPGDKSDRLVEHLRVLAHCTRELNACRSGRALLRMWAEESQKHPDHFINHVILPQGVPSSSYFKTFRWSSKAIASVLSQYLSHRVALAQRWTQLMVAEEVLKPLAKLAEIGGDDWDWFTSGKFDPTLHIKGIGVVGDVIKTNPIDLTYLSVTVQTSRWDETPIEALVFSKNHAKFVENWIDAGGVKDFGRNAQLLDAKLLGSTLLDIVNVALALSAVREQDDVPGFARAFATFSVHSMNLAVTVAELYIEELKLKARNQLIARSVLARIRAVAGAYLAYAGYADAVKAFRSGDSDQGFALAVAATAEAAAVVGYVWLAVSYGTAIAPWVPVLAGLVAAGAYIAAVFLADDPLQMFLCQCEWGVRPYSASDTPRWSSLTVKEWKGDFVQQQYLLIKIIARISVEWVRYPYETSGIAIKLAVVLPSTTVSVQYRALYSNGSSAQEDFSFTAAELGAKLPVRVLVAPRRTLNDWAVPHTLIARIVFRLSAEQDDEVLYFALRLENKTSTTRSVSNVT